MTKYKKITILILIFFLAIPSVSLGSSFAVSLIQGKSPTEAIQIIAEQLDSLFGRVKTLETKQVATDQSISQTNLEIERLKLENENLHLKTEQISTQTEQIRINEDRKLKCASITAQIGSKEKSLKQPFLEKINPLNDELRKLRIELQIKNTQSYPQDSGWTTEEATNKFKEWKNEIDVLKNEINNKNKEIDTIIHEMEKATDSLRMTPEMESLINEANKLLCA